MSDTKKTYKTKPKIKKNKNNFIKYTSMHFSTINDPINSKLTEPLKAEIVCDSLGALMFIGSICSQKYFNPITTSSSDWHSYLQDV